MTKAPAKKPASREKKSKAKEWPRIRSRKNAAGTISWLVDPGTRMGAEKRQRFFFKTKQEAETKAEQMRIGKLNLGAAAAGISDKLRIEALECQKRLAPLSATITQAVDYFIAHARPSGGEKTIRDVRIEFLAVKKGAGRREEYLRVQKAVLENFGKRFDKRLAHEVSASEIEAWMNEHAEWAPRTRLNYFRDLRNFFGFATKKKRYVASNPLLELEEPSEDETVPEILSPEQAGALLAAAKARGGKILPFVAIGLFAGLRTAELLKLDWKDVDFEDRTITVDGAASKTRQARYVPMSDNLRTWLLPCRPESGRGPIKPSAWRYHFEQARKLAKIEPWPHNAMRHSFGSYHFAAYDEAQKTAAALGHGGSTRTLFAHYRKLAKAKTAAAFWAILPPDNVVSIAA